jgi:hypothetical protein
MMLGSKSIDNTRISIGYHALSTRAIRQMTTPRLIERREYIDRQLKLWNQPLAVNHPQWFAEAARRWRNALNSERRRIGKELAERESAQTEAFAIAARCDDLEGTR